MFPVDLVYYLHTHDVCLSCMRWLDLLFTLTQIRDGCRNGRLGGITCVVDEIEGEERW